MTETINHQCGHVSAGADHIATSRPSSTEPLSSAEGPPRGFRLSPTGVERLEKGDWKPLCSTLRVVAVTTTSGGENWGRLVELVDGDGRTHEVVIPAELFAGDGRDVVAMLLSKGLVLAPGSHARGAVIDLLMRWPPAARVRPVSRLGWVDDRCDSFVLGSGRVIGDQQVAYQSLTADTASEMRAAGSLDDWRDAVAAPAIGNPTLVFAIASALAGSLLEPLGLEGGGFHFRGASSRGKSTLLSTAASVWGAPGFVQSWRSTTNGLEAVAQACNSTLLVLDELGEIDAKEADAAAYMLANGCGKQRARRSGAPRARATWRLLYLSSGEIALAAKLVEAGRRERSGQAVRFIDLLVDDRIHGAFDDIHGDPDGATFADRLKRATAKSFGVAGPAFVEALIRSKEKAIGAARSVLAESTEELCALAGRAADGQVKRAAARFALVAAAGELATAFDLTGWPKDAAIEAAVEMFRGWLSARGGAGSTESRDAIERTQSFLSRHGSSRFEALHDCGGEPSRVHNRAGWRDPQFFYVATGVWRSEIHGGADATRAARDLLAAGLLIRGDGDNLATRLPSSVKGRPRAYCIRAEILGFGVDGLNKDGKTSEHSDNSDHIEIT